MLHPVGIMTIGIIKLEYFLLNLDWAVFESTTIRTAAEGSKSQYGNSKFSSAFSGTFRHGTRYNELYLLYTMECIMDGHQR